MMETDGPGILFTIIAFIGGFSVLVFIHEFGHFSVARLFGVKVDTFSIGMGKEVYGWTAKSGTRWRLSAIPLGGYVKFFGDASAASNPGDLPDGLTEAEKSECFHFKPLWQKALIVFAGPAINLIAAALIFAGFYFAYGLSIAEPVVQSVEEGSAAETAGLKVGDKILSIDGRDVDRFSDIGSIVRLYPAGSIIFDIERGADRVSVPVTLSVKYMEDRFGNKYPYGYLGISSPPLERMNLGVFGALSEGSRQTVQMTKTMLTTLGQMILGVRSVKELGGPVRIANMVGEAAHVGLDQFIWMLALLSLNLGIVNLLPIPVLDGGHLVFYALEGLKGSPLNPKALQAGFVAGAALMLIFMVLVTLNDLQSMAL